jgi:predicted DNA-binding transcriptional regulator AlpA
MNEIDYEKLATAIANRMRMLPPADAVIWDSKQCAEYLNISQKHFTDRVSKGNGFPSPIKLPAENGRGHARWYAHEIQEWVKTHKCAV